jgi:hypothetical protein
MNQYEDMHSAKLLQEYLNLNNNLKDYKGTIPEYQHFVLGKIFLVESELLKRLEVYQNMKDNNNASICSDSK